MQREMSTLTPLDTSLKLHLSKQFIWVAPHWQYVAATCSTLQLIDNGSIDCLRQIDEIPEAFPYSVWIPLVYRLNRKGHILVILSWSCRYTYLMIRIVTWSRERKSLYLSQDEEIDPNISSILYTLLCTKYIVDTLMWRGEGSTLGHINSEYNLGTPSNKRLISLRITLLPLVCRLGSRGRVKTCTCLRLCSSWPSLMKSIQPWRLKLDVMMM